MKVRDLCIDNRNPFTLIAGPCSLEGSDHAIFMAKSIKTICHRLDIPHIFKASFDKANRTSIHSPRGMGEIGGLLVLKDISQNISPVLTDIHHPYQVLLAENHSIDVIQIPAFLCRQTDLLVRAGASGCAINVKKGQFMAPEDMKHVIEKLKPNTNFSITERGTSFGYNNLVVDFRSLEIMKNDCNNTPIIFDATHSVQKPGGGDGKSTGDREFVFPLAKAAMSIGVAGLFLEVHDNPDVAISDGPNMVKLEDLEDMLIQLKRIDEVVKGYK
jgi:2-dehydro-3-deoxyphosphooctonate aldolase (KDO 8-P synthase)